MENVLKEIQYNEICETMLTCCVQIVQVTSFSKSIDNVFTHIETEGKIIIHVSHDGTCFARWNLSETIPKHCGLPNALALSHIWVYLNNTRENLNNTRTLPQ